MAGFAGAATAPAPVTVKWLDGAAPGTPSGVTWGVPWPKGALAKDTPLALRDAQGQPVPVQSWPLAYWADGSLKWTGHAISATAATAGPLQLAPGAPAAPATPLTVSREGDAVVVDTGALRARISGKDGTLIETLHVGAREVARAARLVGLREDRTQLAGEGLLRQVPLQSKVTAVAVEQSGPVRAVVRVDGVHQEKGGREWLPFTVRLYFYAGAEPVRLVHTFIYDGDDRKDFIKALGVEFTVPFAEEAHNRHARFAGDVDGGGMWVQPVRLLPGYRNRVPPEMYDEHLAGRRTPNLADLAENMRAAVETCPIWGDLRLTQLGPNGFTIDKRTTAASGWLHVTDGRRAPGLALLGDVSGGIAVGLKDFWQKFPSALEINDAGTAAGRLTVWLWAPHGEAMDVRTYDTVPHNLDVNYEDWKEGWNTPYGVANTHELTLWAFAAIPPNDALVKMAEAVAQPPALVCTPEYYYSVRAFGFWGLPDRSTPARAWVEDRLDGFAKFYRDQVDQRSWYGFWDFGDIMHHYDFDRHEWRYDIGGWAWMNNELAPDMFFWTMFLRSGDPAAYRFALAMTRHTSEVDVHHLGIFAPLGSRHNVNHWGDGAKQPRISEAGLKRYAYYLTGGDERLGDLMREQLPARLAYDYVRFIDPRSGRGANQPFTVDGRLDVAFVNPATQAMRAGSIPPEDDRFGLDWTCYVINWMTEWERTGNPAWGERVRTLMRNITPAEPNAPLIGGGYFDVIFGGPEIMFELEQMVDYPEFWAAWANSAQNLSTVAGNQMTAPRMAAYAAFKKNDPELGRRAWQALLGNDIPSLPASPLAGGPDLLDPVNDPVFLGGSVSWQLHGAASMQWVLNAIETLELAKAHLPAWEANAATETGAGARGGQGPGSAAAGGN